jgi:hypothetical protein
MTLTPTSGKAWRERVRGGVVLTLPSGLVARVRSVNPDTIIRLGRIPDSLTPLLLKVMEGSGDAWTPTTVEELSANVEFINTVCMTVLVEPRIVETPTQDDEIGMDDLEWADKVFLVGAVGTTTRQLESFRDEPAGAVGAVDAPKRDGARRQRHPAHPPVGA